jgi:hypothetical protein
MKNRSLQRILLAILAALSIGLLAGCSTPKVEQYAQEKPVLDLTQYFNGKLDAYGIFTDRSGAVVKRFTVVMDCKWSGNEGTLDEDFTYSDGSKQRRVWRLTRLGDGRFTGKADDVEGVAQGEVRGNAFHWTYTLNLPVDGRVVAVQFDDWMYLMNDKVMLNKASMRKWGIELGEVTLSFVKR